MDDLARRGVRCIGRETAQRDGREAHVREEEEHALCVAAVALGCLATAALDFDRKRFGRTDAVMLTLGCSHTGYVAAIFLIPALSG